MRNIDFTDSINAVIQGDMEGPGAGGFSAGGLLYSDGG